MASPVLTNLRRLPSNASVNSGSTKHEEDLINAYEAEEERIINVLSRKLEQLREEKIALENALEAESESHVNRLSRELTLLRQQQQQNEGIAPSPPDGSSTNGLRMNGILVSGDPRFPGAEAMLDAMRRENEMLRNKLVNTERDYIRVTRLNEMYREELIDHRRRLGLSVDNLIGLSGEAYSQPLHLRRNSTSSSSSPSPLPLPLRRPDPLPISTTASVPIPGPRPPSQPQYRSAASSSQLTSESTTPLTASPSSSMPASPFPFSPPNPNPLSNHMHNPNSSGIGTGPSSYATQITTPPSSTSPNYPLQNQHIHPPLSLSYPSVPPPSLSSSLGSPVVPFAPTSSPIDSRRNSTAAQSGRRVSLERGARVAETGSLRGRRPSTVSQLGRDNSTSTGGT